jgi:hypothetical protein
MFIVFVFRKWAWIPLIIFLIILSFIDITLLFKTPIGNGSSFMDEELKKTLKSAIQNLFDLKNEFILARDKEGLGSLYNKEDRHGLWGYEEEVKKMEYLHDWAEKQQVDFKNIYSQVLIKNISGVGDSYNATLMVSTQYEYVYRNDLTKENFFRIGTYHAFTLQGNNGDFIINKDWYKSPFEGSMNLEDVNIDKVKEIIKIGSSSSQAILSDRRIKAVAYAEKYCGSASLPEYGFQYNKSYRNFNPEGGDCANFASQILFEGGGFSKNSQWNYTKGNGSKAWVNANGFHNYMIYSGRASTINYGKYLDVTRNSYKLLPGDYVAYEKKGKITHISVVTALDSKGYALVDSHNADRYRVPWDLGWSNDNIKFYLVRVHY